MYDTGSSRLVIVAAERSQFLPEAIICYLTWLIRTDYDWRFNWPQDTRPHIWNMWRHVWSLFPKKLVSCFNCAAVCLESGTNYLAHAYFTALNLFVLHIESRGSKFQTHQAACFPSFNLWWYYWVILVQASRDLSKCAAVCFKHATACFEVCAGMFLKHTPTSFKHTSGVYYVQESILYRCISYIGDRCVLYNCRL